GALAHGQRCTHVVAARARRHERGCGCPARRALLDGRGEHNTVCRSYDRRPARRDERDGSRVAVRATDQCSGCAVCGACAVHGCTWQRVRAGPAPRALHRSQSPMKSVFQYCNVLLLLASVSGCVATEPDGPQIVLADSGAGNPTVAADALTGRAYAAWIETTDS